MIVEGPKRKSGISAVPLNYSILFCALRKINVPNSSDGSFSTFEHAPATSAVHLKADIRLRRYI
jgi:hypothetical protein